MILRIRKPVKDVVEPAAPDVKSLLEMYVAAFETSDVQMLARVLQAVVAIEVIPSRTWFSGMATCVPFLAAEAMFSPGDWRLLPTMANGQLAAAAYLRDASETHRAYGLAVLTCGLGGIQRITVFADPELVVKAGFPPNLQP